MTSGGGPGMRLLAALLVLVATGTGRAAEPPGAEAARGAVRIADDPLELEVRFDSRDVELRRQGLLRRVWFDVFLRAFADKRTGRSRFQVYVSDTYRSRLWTRWVAANYATADGPRQVLVMPILQARGSCVRYAGCTRNETVGFAVPEAVLRDAAGADAAWTFKLKGQDGTDRIERLSAAEIGAVLAAVDGWRSARGLAARP